MNGLKMGWSLFARNPARQTIQWNCQKNKNMVVVSAPNFELKVVYSNIIDVSDNGAARLRISRISRISS